jgi:hypothetical protein
MAQTEMDPPNTGVSTRATPSSTTITAAPATAARAIPAIFRRPGWAAGGSLSTLVAVRMAHYPALSWSLDEAGFGTGRNFPGHIHLEASRVEIRPHARPDIDQSGFCHCMECCDAAIYNHGNFYV